MGVEFEVLPIGGIAMMKRWMVYGLLLMMGCGLFVPGVWAEEVDEGYVLLKDLRYRDGEGGTPEQDYIVERCRLDIYHPKKKGYATVVWFHGGGLRGGNKHLPEALRGKGIAVVAVNYRLFPKVKSPVYIDDAAAATAWVVKNIHKYGGDGKKVFVSGHSAGGYLTSMVGLDKKYLKKYGVDADELAGLIPYSGHTITHFTVREERGVKKERPVLDEMAPLFHVRKDAPPILIVTGDRELEMLGRYEENAYFWRMLKVVGHDDVTIKELQGYDHGGMARPAHPLLLKFVKRIEKGMGE